MKFLQVRCGRVVLRPRQPVSREREGAIVAPGFVGDSGDFRQKMMLQQQENAVYH